MASPASRLPLLLLCSFVLFCFLSVVPSSSAASPRPSSTSQPSPTASRPSASLTRSRSQKPSRGGVSRSETASRSSFRSVRSSRTPTHSRSSSVTPTISFSSSKTAATSRSPSFSSSFSGSPSRSFSSSITPSPSSSPSFSSSISFSPSFTPTISFSPSDGFTPSNSASSSLTPISSITPTTTSSHSTSSSHSPTTSPTFSDSYISTPSFSFTPSLSFSTSLSPSPSFSISRSERTQPSLPLQSTLKKSNTKNTRTPTRTPKPTPNPGLEVLNPQCSQDKDYLCPNGKCVNQMQDCEYGNGKGNPDREGEGNFEEDIFGSLEVDEFEETIRLDVSAGNSTVLVGTVTIPPNTLKPGWRIAFEPGLHTTKSKDDDCSDGEKPERNRDVSPSFDLNVYDEKGDLVKDPFKNSLSFKVFARFPSSSWLKKSCYGFRRKTESEWSCLDLFDFKKTQDEELYVIESEADHLTSFATLLATSIPVCGWNWISIASLALVAFALAVTIFFALMVFNPTLRAFIYGYSTRHSLGSVQKRMAASEASRRSQG